MSGGESDAIREVWVTNTDTANTANITSTYYPSTYYPSYTYTYPSTIYMYQITCPKRGCRVMNWGQLDHIITCKGCGSKLKAVSQTVDFEVPVQA